MTTPPPTSDLHKQNHKRNRSIFLSVTVFIILGAGWFTYWFVWGRFYQSTTDAYVDGNNVILTPQVSGIVVSFSAMSSDFVPKGRILVELDKTDAQIALDQSLAELDLSVRHVIECFERVKQYEAMIAMKKAEFVKSAQDYEHRKNLIDQGGVSKEDFEHSEASLHANYADLIATEHLYLAAVSQVENTTVETHPLVEKAKSRVQDAFVFYQRCTIKAPVSGIVAQRSVQVGQRVHSGQPLMALIPLDQMWVTANFKEVQLVKMRIGQRVSIISDIYGSDVKYQGIIEGIGGGTGSVFSLLPPQNATGNWIKIVQRVPVRVSLDQDLVLKHPLRLGLSMDVTVDIHDTQKPFIPNIRPEGALYETDVFKTQEEGSKLLIDQVILRAK